MKFGAVLTLVAAQLFNSGSASGQQFIDDPVASIVDAPPTVLDIEPTRRIEPRVANRLDAKYSGRNVGCEGRPSVGLVVFVNLVRATAPRQQATQFDRS